MTSGSFNFVFELIQPSIPEAFRTLMRRPCPT